MSISVNTLDRAIAEAKRFLEAAAEVKRSARSYPTTSGRIYEGGSACAAAKRASMDLSKILARVRSSGL